MAAVSALPNGRGLRDGGSVPQDADAWDFAQRSSPEVRFLVEAASDLWPYCLGWAVNIDDPWLSWALTSRLHAN